MKIECETQDQGSRQYSHLVKTTATLINHQGPKEFEPPWRGWGVGTAAGNGGGAARVKGETGEE